MSERDSLIAFRLPWWLKRCKCRSYHGRTGIHSDACPRFTNA